MQMENREQHFYHLSVHISEDGYKISVLDETGTELSSKRVTASLFRMQVHDIEALLGPEFSINAAKVRIVYESDVYVFVPVALFDPNEAVYYLSFQHKIAKNERIVFNGISAWDTVNVFTIPNALLTALMNLVPDANIEHHMSVLLTNEANASETNELHVHVRSKMVDLILVQSGKLQLLNSFSCQATDDYVYHTMNAIELLNVDSANTSFYLHNGKVNGEIEKHLSNYLQVTCR